MSMSQRPVPAVLLVLCAAAACTDTDGLGPSVHEADETAATVEHQLPAKKYALVLGNSLSFGWQPTGDVFDATSYHTGFSTLFVERLNATRNHPHVTEVNLACPGESTKTFVHGGCFYTDLLGFPLHTTYRGSQLHAAEAFLKHHRGQVNPIILSLGANELYRPYLLDCGGDEACVDARIPAAIQSVTENYAVILRRLRVLAPHASLLLLVEYEFPQFPHSFNAGLAAIYPRVRAAGRTYGATLVEADPIIREDPCTLLFICDALQDIHPTDAGYRALANALWEAAGFAGLAAGGPQ
jgi:lysophospholipase L1-like esterase